MPGISIALLSGFVNDAVGETSVAAGRSLAATSLRLRLF